MTDVFYSLLESLGVFESGCLPKVILVMASGIFLFFVLSIMYVMRRNQEQRFTSVCESGKLEQSLQEIGYVPESNEDEYLYGVTQICADNTGVTEYLGDHTGDHIDHTGHVDDHMEEYIDGRETDYEDAKIKDHKDDHAKGPNDDITYSGDDLNYYTDYTNIRKDDYKDLGNNSTNHRDDPTVTADQTDGKNEIKNDKNDLIKFIESFKRLEVELGKESTGYSSVSSKDIWTDIIGVNEYTALVPKPELPGEESDNEIDSQAAVGKLTESDTELEEIPTTFVGKKELLERLFGTSSPRKPGDKPRHPKPSAKLGPPPKTLPKPKALQEVLKITAGDIAETKSNVEDRMGDDNLDSVLPTELLDISITKSKSRLANRRHHQGAKAIDMEEPRLTSAYDGGKLEQSLQEIGNVPETNKNEYLYGVTRRETGDNTGFAKYLEDDTGDYIDNTDHVGGHTEEYISGRIVHYEDDQTNDHKDDLAEGHNDDITCSRDDVDYKHLGYDSTNNEDISTVNTDQTDGANEFKNDANDLVEYLQSCRHLKDDKINANDLDLGKESTGYPTVISKNEWADITRAKEYTAALVPKPELSPEEPANEIESQAAVGKQTEPDTELEEIPAHFLGKKESLGHFIGDNSPRKPGDKQMCPKPAASLGSPLETTPKPKATLQEVPKITAADIVEIKSSNEDEDRMRDDNLDSDCRLNSSILQSPNQNLDLRTDDIL